MLFFSPTPTHASVEPPVVALAETSSPSPPQIKARQYLLICVVMLGCWLMGELLAWVGWIDSPLGHALAGVRYASFYFVMMFACICLLHLGTRPPQGEWRAICMLGPSLAGLLLVLEPVTSLGFTLADSACVGFGVASIAILGARVWNTEGNDRCRALCLFLLACMLPLFTVLNPFFQDFTNRLTPTTLDHYAYAADEALGMQWSFVVGQWFEALPPLRIISAVIYYTLLFAFIGVLVVQLRAQRPPYLDIFPTLIVTTLVGYTVYLLFPLVGPAAVFDAAFPGAAPEVSAVLSVPLDIPRAPRNCMPSLHTVWVLLIWWHSRPFAWPIRLAAGVYLTFTLLATLGFGFHYLVDLIVAFPFALLVQAQATPSSPDVSLQRRRGLMLGIVLVVAWLLVIRFGLSVLFWSPALGLTATGVTILLSWVQERRLFDAYCTSAASRGC